jgi:hypothetical protein
LGAGIGRVGGAVADRLIPEEYGGGDYKRQGLILGGLAGMLPGAALSYGAFRNGTNLLDGSWMSHKDHKPLVSIDSAEESPVISVVKSVLQKHSAYAGEPFWAEDLDDAVKFDPYLDEITKSRFSGIIKGAAVLSENVELQPEDVGVMALSLGSSYTNGCKVGQLLSRFAGLSEQQRQQLHKSGEFCNTVRAADRIIFR